GDGDAIDKASSKLRTLGRVTALALVDELCFLEAQAPKRLLNELNVCGIDQAGLPSITADARTVYFELVDRVLRGSKPSTLRCVFRRLAGRFGGSSLLQRLSQIFSAGVTERGTSE